MKQARALVMNARLRKKKLTPLKQQQQRRKKQKPSVREIGLHAASGYHGERGSGPSSQLDSQLRTDNTEAAADLQGIDHRRFRRDVVMVSPAQRPGRPCNVPPQDSVVTETRKRRRPRKRGRCLSEITSDPFRNIFSSRRRKVTRAERELALNSAYQLASQLPDSTTCVIVMRQTCVYRNFVLCVPRPFTNHHMPDTHRKVMLVDSACYAWFGVWNATDKYIRGGWRNFILEHCLEEDDALVPEIVEDRPKGLSSKGHLFPVVPVPDGFTDWHSHVCPPFEPLYSRRPNMPMTGVPIDPNVLWRPSSRAHTAFSGSIAATVLARIQQTSPPRRRLQTTSWDEFD